MTDMSRNYRTIHDISREVCLAQWADSRETHIAVAAAIHAIADNSRRAETIWASPTSAEVDHVTLALEEYRTHGDTDPEPNGVYCWGDDNVTLGEED
jgi:hypothetical protein